MGSLSAHLVAWTATLALGLLAIASVPRESSARTPRSTEGLGASVVQLERAIVDRVNRIRVAHRLPLLQPDAELAAIARAHSCHMAREGFFAHAPPSDEGSVADRLREVGREFRAVAENLARNAGVPDPAAAAVEEWMQSEGHRANLLGPSFTQTGVGVCAGDPGHYITQILIAPR